MSEVERSCVNGGRCTACDKQSVAADAHCRSYDHIYRMKEPALENRIFGPTLSARRHGEGCRVLSKKALWEYWGAGLENLPDLLKTQMAADKRIHLKVGGKKSKTRMLDRSDIKSYHLAILKYDLKSGHYRNNKYPKASMHFWHTVVEEEVNGQQAAHPVAPDLKVGWARGGPLLLFS